MTAFYSDFLRNPRYQKAEAIASRDLDTREVKIRNILNSLAGEEMQKQIQLKELGMKYGKGGIAEQQLGLQRQAMQQGYGIREKELSQRMELGKQTLAQNKELSLAGMAYGREMRLGEMGYKYGQWQQDYGQRKSGYYQALPFAVADVGAKFAMGYGQMKADYRTAQSLENLAGKYQASQEGMGEYYKSATAYYRKLLEEYSIGR